MIIAVKIPEEITKEISNANYKYESKLDIIMHLIKIRERDTEFFESPLYKAYENSLAESKKEFELLKNGLIKFIPKNLSSEIWELNYSDSYIRLEVEPDIYNENKSEFDLLGWKVIE